jgi:hypothetical protein
MSARPVSQRLQDHIRGMDQCDSESDMTVSSLPELGHMLVFCLRRIIMETGGGNASILCIPDEGYRCWLLEGVSKDPHA